MRPTYWDYLKLDRLLSLQGGLEEDESLLQPDELHFIVVHQVYELWFKLMLREIRLAREHLAAPRVPEEKIPFVVHHLRRVNEILKLAGDQFRIMETLPPQDFLDFRDKLTPASGFQSFQMREIEILLGLEEPARVAYGGTDPFQHLRDLAEASPGGAFAMARVTSARSEKTLKDALKEWLYRTPIDGSSPGDPGDEAHVAAFVTGYLDATARHAEELTRRATEGWGGDATAIRQRFMAAVDAGRQFLHATDAPEETRDRERRIRAGLLFVESYRELPLVSWPRLLVDSIVELEEYLVLWRTRHARMVERTIGRRAGTGGSPGVDYLDRTAQYRIFSELWAVRTLLLPREYLPRLSNAPAYGFAR